MRPRQSVGLALAREFLYRVSYRVDYVLLSLVELRDEFSVPQERHACCGQKVFHRRFVAWHGVDADDYRAHSHLSDGFDAENGGVFKMLFDLR